MRKQKIALTFAAAIVGVFAMSAAMAERPPGAGGGGGGGGSNAPPDYGDLIVLYRDPSGSGIPVLTADSCVQPLAAETFDGCIDIPGTDPADCRIIPVDPQT